MSDDGHKKKNPFMAFISDIKNSINFAGAGPGRRLNENRTTSNFSERHVSTQPSRTPPQQPSAAALAAQQRFATAQKQSASQSMEVIFTLSWIPRLGCVNSEQRLLMNELNFL